MPRPKAPRVVWSTFGGSGREGVYSYGARGPWGYLDIVPMMRRRRGGAPYELRWANEKGLSVSHLGLHSGLWHTFGRFPTYRQAQAAGQRFVTALWHS